MVSRRRKLITHFREFNKHTKQVAITEMGRNDEAEESFNRTK
jgi:hypothetical protein